MLLSIESGWSYLVLLARFVHLGSLVIAWSLSAQTTVPSAVRLPPAGISIPATNRDELMAGASALRNEIVSLEKKLQSKPQLLALLPDLEIFHKAVDWALRYDEFFDLKQIAFAKTLLQQGNDRAVQLAAGQTPWLDSTGLVVRGYRSKLDGSIQPFGVLIPASWKRESKPRPLYVWLAGRNEKRTELAFLNERETSAGSLKPQDAIVLHPYGRFCNATKFAGEVDVFEAMETVRSQYPIDSNRLVVAGFSMGGASAWHLAVHHSGLWCAASPGAGFAETAIFAKIFAEGKEQPPEWEQKLWRWYDATDCAGNLFNCPTIAYSGEIDPQKQSADIMEKAMAAEGLKLERLIGPQTAHKYHPDTLKELASRLDALVAAGKNPLPSEVHLTTYTLQYPEADWVRIEGLERHWERADVRAARDSKASAHLTTTNVSAVRLNINGLQHVSVDGHEILVPTKTAATSVSLHKTAQGWSLGEPSEPLRKKPGLTGPIDDCFMSAFLFVRPSGHAMTPEVGRWTENELAHASKMWRDIFRGDAPTKDDSAVSQDDIATKNLILWGDPSSNRLLAKMLDKLPLEWTRDRFAFNGQTYDATRHAPILIFPNPLNPARYVVLNSGIDFRNDAYGSNAKQTPKLPDWAIVSLDVPPGPRWPGKIAAAGFFDERWQLSR
jgi:pimeloyl-ACP methyl ester carboxylesterase